MRNKILVLSTFFISPSLHTAATFTVSPLNVAFPEDKSQEWIKIKNSSEAKEAIAVELQILPREQDPIRGMPILKKDITDDKDCPFIFTPNKVVLFPGENQMLSLKKANTNSVNKEKIYTMLVK